MERWQELGSAFEAAKTEVIKAAGDKTFNSAAEAANALEINDQAKEDIDNHSYRP